MPDLLDPAALMKGTPVKPVQVIRAEEGRLVRPLGLAFRWKVTGTDTGYAFAVYEMRMDPGSGIPMHVHPFAEFFYVLEGVVDAVSLDNEGVPTSVSLSERESLNAPPNTPHGLRNTSERPARFLSVASFEHEEAFNRIERVMAEKGRDTLSEAASAELFIQLAAETQTYFVAG